MEAIKLDKIDKKILLVMFHDFRQPLTKVAKQCHISREQVEYRLKKYEKSGLLRGYLTLFNMSTLGFSEFYYLRLKNKKIDLTKIVGNENVAVIDKGVFYGAWDSFLIIYAKSKQDFLNFISKLYEDFSNDILEYDIFEPIEVNYYPLKNFGKSTNDTIQVNECNTNFVIDDLDKEIINILSINANTKIVDMAKELNKSIETIQYRLKRLEKNIIIGYRMFLDPDVLGYNLSIFYVKFNNLSKDLIKRLRKHSDTEKRVSAFSIGIGRHNVIFQFLYEHQFELREELNNIKEKFAEHIVEYDLTHLEYEHDPKMSPY